MPSIICLGDSSTRGCVVVSCKQTQATISGKQIAIQGDLCKCVNGGNCTITQGSPNHDINGVPVAYTGCVTSCGSSLIGTTVDGETT
jgi:uncharacterized Zn-binding protein involved in type VI secretion